MVARANLAVGKSKVRGTITAAPTVAIESVNMKPQIGKGKGKGDLQWQYPKGVIMRAPSTTINGTPHTDHRDTTKPRRKVETNYLWTINFNKFDDSLKGGYQHIEVKNAMKEMMEEMKRESTLVQYLQFGRTNSHYMNDKYVDVVEDIRFEGNVETGEKRNRIHAHAFVFITHYSQVSYNLPMMKYIAMEAYNRHITTPKLKATTLPYIFLKRQPQSYWNEVQQNAQYLNYNMKSGQGTS